MILVNQFTATFTIKSTNYPLIIFSHYSQLINLELTLEILVAITLILFVFGSWAHKMLGVEIIYPFLFIYLTISIEGLPSSEILSPLKKLRYLANYGEFFNGSLVGVNNIAKDINLREKFIENNFIITLLLFIGILIPIGMTIYNRIKKSSKRNQNFNKKWFSIFFKLFHFPLVVGYLSYTFFTVILSILSD